MQKNFIELSRENKRMQPLSLIDIKKVLILGSGTLGTRVALQSAISGFETNLYDISESSLMTAKAEHERLLDWLISLRKIAPEDKIIAQEKLKYTSDAALAARDVDFVNESVTENLEIKKQVWKQFGELCPAHTLFTTNSSFLLPSDFSEDTGRPNRFCAFHFHDVFIAKVVDIMPHDKTETWVVDLLMDLAKKLNQIPVKVMKESKGYLFNYMLMNILTSAAELKLNGIGSIQDIDRSFMGNFGLPLGPFGMMDQVGLDTALHIAKNSESTRGDRFASVLKPLIEKGCLGIKNGKGFYQYPNPEFKKKEFLD